MTYPILEELLERRLAQRRFRQLQPFIARPPTDPHLHFAYQDLFFLAGHPFIKQRALDAVARWGSGSHQLHRDEQRKVENHLAHLLQKHRVFLFSSTESLHQEISNALHHPKLELLTVKTLSPHTGELWDEALLIDHKKKQNAIFYADDSAAFGLYGWGGLGLARSCQEVDITLIHFQSTFALPLTALCVSPFFAEFFEHYLEPKPPIYPSLLGALRGCLELLPDLEEERRHIMMISKLLRGELLQKGWNIGSSQTHIIPLYLPYKQEIESLSHFLADVGISAQRPLRFLLHSKHNFTSLKYFISVLTDWKSSQ